MSNVEVRQALLETYGDNAASYPSYRFSIPRLKRGDCNVSDKQRPEGSNNFEDKELRDLLEEHPTSTNFQTAQQCLHMMREVQREENKEKFSMAYSK